MAIKTILFGTLIDLKNEIDFTQAPPMIATTKLCAIIRSDAFFPLPNWINPVLVIAPIRNMPDIISHAERILMFLDAVQSSNVDFTILCIGENVGGAIAKFAKVAKPDIDIRGQAGNIKHANELLFDELMRQWVIKLGEHANVAKRSNANIE